MQKTENLEESSKPKSKNNTPRKKSMIKIIKSPINVIRNENMYNQRGLIRSKSLKNFIEKNENLVFNNKTNFEGQTKLKKNKIERENKKMLINNLKKNLNSNKIITEMNEKSFKEKIKKNNFSNFANSFIDKHNFVNIKIEEKNTENEYNIENQQFENNIDKDISEFSTNARKNIKIESKKNLIPPNNVNLINEIINNNKKIKNGENINEKFEENINCNLEDIEYLKLANSKKKKEWKSWSLSEKELFYEAIANGANYTSLQKLFKNMNDKIGTKSTEKIRDYYYRALKNVNKLLKSVGDNGINRKNRDEVLLALNCYGKIITSSNSKKSNNLDAMKKLNKHPRLFKKTALTLKKLITTKVKSMRVKKISNSFGNRNNKMKQSCKLSQIKKDVRNQNNINHGTTIMKIIDPDLSRKIPYEKFIVRLYPNNQETYFKMIEANYNARLELIVAYNRSIKHVIEILTNKWKNVIKKNSVCYLSLFPISELWISNQNIVFKLDDEKYYDIGDIYSGYGNPQTNILYLQYKWLNTEIDIEVNNFEKTDSNEIDKHEIIKIKSKDSCSWNKKGDKNNEKLFNNSSLIISEIKDNNEKIFNLTGLNSFVDGNSDLFSDFKGRSNKSNKNFDKLLNGLKLADIIEETTKKSSYSGKKDHHFKFDNIKKENFHSKNTFNYKNLDLNEKQNKFDILNNSYIHSIEEEENSDNFNSNKNFKFIKNKIKHKSIKQNKFNKYSKNSNEESENSDEEKEKSFTPLEQEYDDFDPLEYLGVYNDNKKIDDVQNSYESESDFEKRFFEHENDNSEFIIENKRNNILNSVNKYSFNKSNSFVDNKDNLSKKKIDIKEEYGSYQKNLNLRRNLEISKAKIKTKKMKSIGKKYRISENFHKNGANNSNIFNLSENKTKNNTKQEQEKEYINEKEINSQINFSNNNINSEENKFYDRMEFFKKLRNNKNDENIKLLYEDNLTQNNIGSNKNNFNIHQGNEGQQSSRILNFSEMGSKLKSNLSLTFNPNNSNSSVNNLSNLKTNLINNNINSLGNKNITSNNFLLNNNQIHNSNSNSNFQNNPNNSINDKNSINSINKDKGTLNYSNALINSKVLLTGSNQNNSSLLNSVIPELKKNVGQIFEKELSFKNTWNKDENNRTFLNLVNTKINDPIKDLKGSFNDTNIIEKLENLKSCEKVNNKFPDSNNNAQRRQKRIPFVRLTPERIFRERSNISRSTSLANKTINDRINTPQDKINISLIKKNESENKIIKYENKLNVEDDYLNKIGNSEEKSEVKEEDTKINSYKDKKFDLISSKLYYLNLENLNTSFQKFTELTPKKIKENEDLLQLTNSQKENNMEIDKKMELYSANKNNFKNNKKIQNEQLEKKEENNNEMVQNNPYFFQESSNYVPLGGNLTNLFYDHENSMRIFQNNNYNSNIFYADNLFHSNNFNSLFIKNHNNEDSNFIKKNINPPHLKSNISPFNFMNNTNFHQIDKDKNNKNLIIDEKAPKFNSPDMIVVNPNIKNKLNSENKINENFNKQSNNHYAFNSVNSIKLNETHEDKDIQLTKKKTNRNKKKENSNLKNSNSKFASSLGENQNRNRENSSAGLTLNLSSTEKKRSENKTDKKSSQIKYSNNDKTQSKISRRTEPIKLEELLNETEKNSSYLSKKNTSIQNQIENMSTKKGKSIKNSINSSIINNSLCNTNKKSWIINQNNYFNNYPTTAQRLNPRFINTFANIDIPDPSGFIGKSKKNQPQNMNFINTNFCQFNPLNPQGYINPAFVPIQKIPIMYVPNYVFGDYDVNKVEYGNMGFFPGQSYISNTLNSFDSNQVETRENVSNFNSSSNYHTKSKINNVDLLDK